MDDISASVFPPALKNVSATGEVNPIGGDEFEAAPDRDAEDAAIRAEFHDAAAVLLQPESFPEIHGICWNGGLGWGWEPWRGISGPEGQAREQGRPEAGRGAKDKTSSLQHHVLIMRDRHHRREAENAGLAVLGGRMAPVRQGRFGGGRFSCSRVVGRVGGSRHFWNDGFSKNDRRRRRSGCCGRGFFRRSW